MILLDTCVVSEGLRPEPDRAYIRWLRFQDPLSLFISVITVGELHYGAAQLQSGMKQREINSWIGDVERRFANRIIVLDDIVAKRWGYLRAAYPKAQTADAQLAATAMAHDFVFATRNVRHFLFDGLKIVNPWKG